MGRDDHHSIGGAAVLRAPAIRSLCAALLTLSACAAESGAVPSPQTQTPRETASVGVSSVPSSILPTPAVTAEASLAPTLSAEPIGDGPEQTCANVEAGYALSYPGDWYVLPSEEAPRGACTAFGPQPFSGDDGASILAVDLDGACYDSSGDVPLVEEHFTVDGFATVRREWDPNATVPGMTYVIDRNPVRRCGVDTHLLLFEADEDRPGDWETNMRVLDRMVSTIDFGQ